MLALLLRLSLCFACADSRAEAWIGHNLDDLIRAWGPPSASAELSDHTRIVEWSTERSVKEPYNHSDGAGGTYSNTMRLHCRVRIETNPSGVITKADVDGNLGGCNSLFRDKEAPEAG